MLRAPLRHPKIVVGAFVLPATLGIGSELFVTPLYQASEVLVTAGDDFATSVGERSVTENEADLSGVWEAV